jgi:hypothetical protein
VLSARGNVLRLVGLYHAGRGPHTFFIKQVRAAGDCVCVCGACVAGTPSGSHWQLPGFNTRRA